MHSPAGQSTPSEGSPRLPFSEAWKSVEDIDGWLTEGQARMLYIAAQRVAPREAIVEIGSHHGRSTVIMCAAKPEGTPLVAVDPFDDPYWGGGEESLETFRANLARHHATGVSHIRAFGASAGSGWDRGRVGVLFVDGAHDYHNVTRDLDAWLPHLSPTGVVLMHDTYSSPGVTRAAFARMLGARDFVYAGSSRSLVAFQSCAPGPVGRLRSGVQMLSKLPWFGRNLLVKVAHRRGWRAVPVLLGHSGQPFPY